VLAVGAFADRSPADATDVQKKGGVLVLNRPHRLYLLLGVAWLAIFVLVPPVHWWTFAAGTFLIGILAAFYFQRSARVYAERLLARVVEGDEKAQRLYLARTRSRFGDLAREYLETLIAADDERLLPLMVRQLEHPDANAREITEDRLTRWGVRAAEPVARAVVGKELTGDGAFRARRLLYRWRRELPERVSTLLETAGYWQDA
jgi:hypothetical protein